MGTGSRQHQTIVVNVPDQQPVRLDMTFPSKGPLPGQAVGSVARIKRLLGEEQINDGPQLVKVLASSFASSQVPLEALRREQAHGSAVRGLEIVQTFVLGEILTFIGLPQRLARFGVGYLHRKR